MNERYIFSLGVSTIALTRGLVRAFCSEGDERLCMDMDQDPADRACVAHTDQEWVAALGDHLHRQEEADVVAA